MVTRGRYNHIDRKYTEHDIQKILNSSYLSNPKYVLNNLFVFDWESDYLAKTRSGYWYEVEIKTSVSDFKNDAKNKAKKFRILESGYSTPKQMFVQNPSFNRTALRPNYFSYCVTKEIADKVKDVIPQYAGLYYIDEHGILCNMVAPKRLHDQKIKDEQLNLADKFYYNMISWKRRCDGWYKERMELKGNISWLRAEFKAATGYDISEDL